MHLAIPMMGMVFKALLFQPKCCYLKIGSICRKGPNSSTKMSACNKTSLQSDNLLNILSDPLSTFQIDQTVINMKLNLNGMFKKINKTTGIKGLFSLLWNSRLPCYDINGITSLKDGEKSMLKFCFWKGQKIPCAAIFSTFPTDQGMCCSFNMKAGVNFTNVQRAAFTLVGPKSAKCHC